MTASDGPARAGHPYHMHDAIYAQPGALRLLGRGNAEALGAAAGRLRECQRLLLCGAGSSRHAALAAEPLFAEVDSLPACLRVTAETEDGVVMAVQHDQLPLDAVQFHPESIMTLDDEVGLRLIRNVVAHAGEVRRTR